MNCYIPFLKLVILGNFQRISLVGGELPPDYLFLVRPFRVLVEEPLAKYNIK